jgi:predicted Zn-dependent protease
MKILRLMALSGLIALASGCKLDQIVPGDISKLATTSMEALSKASRSLSPEEEHYVGRAVAARLLTTYPLLSNKQLTSYLNSVGQTVALHSDIPATFGGYHFALLDSPEVSAFACPGGTIFISRGMLESTQNEDELAAVLAHEVAHVNHRDGVNSIEKSRWTEAVTVIGAEAAKSYGNREVAQLVSLFEGSIDDVFKTLVVNGYGRSQELAADEFALTILSRAGYDPAALSGYLARMAEKGKFAGGIMKTHPATDERINKVKDALPRSRPDKELVQKRTARFIAMIR